MLPNLRGLRARHYGRWSHRQLHPAGESQTLRVVTFCATNGITLGTPIGGPAYHATNGYALSLWLSLSLSLALSLALSLCPLPYADCTHHCCCSKPASVPLASRGLGNINHHDVLVIADLDRLATSPAETATLHAMHVRVIVVSLGCEINLASPAIIAALASHRYIRRHFGAAIHNGV